MSDDGSAYSHFTLPTAVTFGDGCSASAGDSARELGGTRALVVTDAGVVKAGLVAGVLDALDAAGLPVAVYDGVEPDPPIANVDAARDLALTHGADVLVAVGGGSVIDTAKSAALLLTNGGEVAAYDFTLDEPRPIERPIAPLVAVPTTSGTGSEVTFWAVITDPAQHEKLGLGGPLMTPRVALVDPALTRTMPPAVTTFTGLDALTHAVEAATCTAAGPLSDPLALRAIELVARNLRRAVADGGDTEARRAMSAASLLAGAAFTNADVGAVHCLSEVVGGRFHLPHGEVCAMYLPAVAAYSLEAAPERYAAVAAALGADVAGESALVGAEAAVAALKALLHDLDVPTPAEAGVEPGAHAEMAARCAETVALYAVPRMPSAADFERIFEDANAG